MRHWLTDGDVCEVDSTLRGLITQDSKLTTNETNGHVSRRWDRRYTWINRVEDVFITVPSWSGQWIGPKWIRLWDREHAPRRWWWPAEAQVSLCQEDLQRQHAECSETANRLLFLLLGFCFFCWLTLGGSDVALLGAGREVAVPVINMTLSNGAFLSIGPIILIAFTLYLHILVERLQRYNALDADQRLPHIFNMSSPVPQLLSWFLFYWMVPLVLALFTWKAGPRPEGPIIGVISLAATALLIWLQIRRCPKPRRRWNIPLGVVMIALIALVPLIATRQISLNRTLSLFQAELAKVDLSGFDLRRADLSRANLQGAFLSKANLQEANLQEANLTSAVLEGAVLTKAQLSWAIGLNDVDLRGAHLEEANLSWTNLRQAKLDGVYLHGAVLYKTDLREANLEGAHGLTREQIASAITDETTRLPRYLHALSKE
jgi:hypothetical protein